MKFDKYHYKAETARQEYADSVRGSDKKDRLDGHWLCEFTHDKYNPHVYIIVDIEIRNNETMEIRKYRGRELVDNGTFNSYMWSDGCFSFDENRADFFNQATEILLSASKANNYVSHDGVTYSVRITNPLDDLCLYSDMG